MPARTPLDISTEFMRRIAPDLVPAGDPDPAPRQTAPSVVTPTLYEIPADADPAQRRNDAPRGGERGATVATVVPPLPKATLPTNAPAKPEAPDRPPRRAAAPSSPPAAIRPDRPRPPPPTFGAVERSATIRRGTPAREELAHGVGIMRFGIGQG